MNGALKDRRAESELFTRRAIFCGLGALVLLLILIGRLFDLQIQQHEHFTTLSQGNRVRIQAIPPTRGLIVDRNGQILAENRPAWRLVITPEQVDDMEATLAAIGQIIEINEDDLQHFSKQRRHSRNFSAIPLKTGLSETDVARLAVNRHDWPGVDIEAHLSRHYPFGTAAAHVIGYVARLDENDLARVEPSNYRGTTHYGKTGIERSYEDLLHGTVGHEQIETNAAGRTLRILETSPPEPGQDLQLTLDVDLQLAAETALGKLNGSVVAIDPRNGEVLAMVSKPTYDPNLFVNGISRTAYRALRDDAARPLFNRALQGQYPPGSTIKPFLGLAGLDYHLMSGHNTIFCSGFYQLPDRDHKYRDWKRSGHGLTNLDDAIVQSCDVYFYDLARNMGIDRLHAFMSSFGFGRKTGIDLQGERSGLLPSREWKRQTRNQPWYPGETLITGIGQGFMLSTPLQLAHATTTLANRGLQIRPHLLQNQRRADQETAIEIGYSSEQVVNSQPGNWDYILRAMQRVVHSPRGTAKRIAEGTPFTIAGKTGTAQVFALAQAEEDEEEVDAPKMKDLQAHLRDHALFIAFAPFENPQIAVAVIAEHGGSGGSVAAPVAKDVLRFHLQTDQTAMLRIRQETP